MTTALIAALSLQAKAEQYGAYAGIAAIFGLGVLSLLYFAQAREVKRLREWAGRAPERAAELEARVTAQAEERRGEPAPAPAAAAAAAGVNGAGPAAPAAVPQAPEPAAPVVGVPASERGAPTRAPGVPASLPTAATAATAAVTAAGARATAATAVAGGPRAGVPTSFSGAPQPKPKPAPAPVPAPAPAGATTTAPPAAPAPTGANGGGGAAPPRPPGPAAEPARVPAPVPSRPAPEPALASAGASKPPRQIRTAAAPVRAGSVQATVPPRTIPPRTAAALRERTSRGGGGGRPRRALVLAAGGMAAMVAIVVVLGITLAGGDGDEPAPKPNRVAPPSASVPARDSAPAAPVTRVNRGQVTVAVLNGTTVTGLARGASDKLTKAGFKPGVVTNDTTNQARSATAVLYSQGNRAAALDVARVVSVGRDAVQPIDQGTRLLAGEDADVVVSVGADQSQ